MPNPVLAIAKETWDWGSAPEWLFQMCRLWTEHQSPNTGTCPVEYRDPSGPVAFDICLATGEDSAYWDSVFALLHDQNLLPDTWSEDDLADAADSWLHNGAPSGYDPHRAFEHIRVALKTFDRFDNLYGERY